MYGCELQRRRIDFISSSLLGQVIKNASSLSIPSHTNKKHRKFLEIFWYYLYMNKTRHIIYIKSNRTKWIQKLCDQSRKCLFLMESTSEATFWLDSRTFDRLFDRLREIFDYKISKFLEIRPKTAVASSMIPMAFSDTIQLRN